MRRLEAMRLTSAVPQPQWLTGLALAREAFTAAGPGQGLPTEISVQTAKVFGLGLLKQALRKKITDRRIVLVQRVHGHALGCRAGGLGQVLAKNIMRLVGDAKPVNGTEHDWFRLAKQHHATATQRHGIDSDHRVVGHHVTKWRGGIDVKGGHAQRLIRRSEQPERTRK